MVGINEEKYGFPNFPTSNNPLKQIFAENTYLNVFLLF